MSRPWVVPSLGSYRCEMVILRGQSSGTKLMTVVGMATTKHKRNVSPHLDGSETLQASTLITLQISNYHMQHIQLSFLLMFQNLCSFALSARSDTTTRILHKNYQQELNLPYSLDITPPQIIVNEFAVVVYLHPLGLCTSDEQEEGQNSPYHPIYRVYLPTDQQYTDKMIGYVAAGSQLAGDGAKTALHFLTAHTLY